jgi:hypothetical protein
MLATNALYAKTQCYAIPLGEKLEAVAESTLPESPERERQRVDAERERAAQEREQLLEEF